LFSAGWETVNVIVPEARTNPDSTLAAPLVLF
jgi:hypothetical protein